jgi:signal transduction histidine kinase
MVPAGLLAYIALSSSSAVELQLDADLDRRAETIASDVNQELMEAFARFETQTIDRLMSGQSPLANLAELSPYLRAAFRFDAEGQLVAPISLPTTTAASEPSTFFRREWTRASRLEQDGDHAAAARAYRRAADAIQKPPLAGEAEFAAARTLWRAGREREAFQAFADIYADYANTRDRWGFRIGDLAALKRAEIALEQEPEAGRLALEALVEQILSDRWTAGQPGEAAVARQALAWLEGVADPDWIGRSRIRLNERTSQLFWAGELIDELELFAGDPVRVDSGEFKYYARSESGTLWATLWDGESLYAFSFDYDAIVADLRADLLRISRADEEIFAQILSRDDPTPPDALRSRTLEKWAPFHKVVVGLKDPASILDKKRQMVNTRLVIIGLAVGMSILGVLLSLRLMGGELEMAVMKTDFAANVSHELRSPITQIRLKAEALQLDLARDDADRHAHYDAIVHEAERLSRLVDNVLDFAAIERGVKRYTLRPVDPGQVIQTAVDAFRTHLESGGVQLEVDVPIDLPVVWVDKEAIGQVLANLLNNAAKYGGVGGWIGIRAAVVDETLQVSIADQGIGIDKEEIDHVFDHFFRSANPRVRRRKGTGIGLTIVRYIVEAHGGTIIVESPQGVGTTFIFTLPLEPPAEAVT